MTVSLSHVPANALGSDFTVNVYSSNTRIDSFDASDGVNNEISRGVITGAELLHKGLSLEAGSYQYKLNTDFSTTSGVLK